MNTATCIMVTGLALALFAATAHADEADQPARLTLLLESRGYEHDVVKPRDDGPSVVEQVLAGLGETSGAFEITTLRDVRQLTADRLAETDIVAFYTTGDLPFAEGQYEAFEQWVEQGGRFLGLHSATDTLKDHDRYPKLIGGTFHGHPWNAGDTVTIQVHDADHPAAAPYAPEATFREEIYQFRNFDPQAVRVLISLDMARTEKKRSYHVPIAWSRAFGDGRVFYTSLGHREDVWRSDAYQAHLLGAIQWLMGKAEGSAAPNPDLHERETAKAREAAGG
ncbi:MAG: ThuA domain-containing protein [Phycisphaeraceae bacterium]